MHEQSDGNSRTLFIGCFIALVTTAFGFVGRSFLLNTWGIEFKLDDAQAGRLAGIGVWPFAVSIILFSLFIDRIGYKTAMVIAFVGHLVWAAMGVGAYFVSQGGDPKTAYQIVYWGSLILGLANGTVEAFINPVVATMFSREKTKWLNILHAGWPGGLVITGIIVIFMGDISWAWKVGIIAAPTLLYGVILLRCKFPVSERVASGVSYREMLQEFGILGALVVGFLVTLQLIDFFDPPGPEAPATWQVILFSVIGVGMVLSFALYTRSLGRPLMFFLILIMMPLATTEIGTDSWITAIMEGIAGDWKIHAGWVLVYTSAIMLVLRLYAGAIVHRISPLGLLAVSSMLAIAGLYTLSFTAGWWIIAAATIYGFGKTFFWPTMLGVVSEQCPRGGALTLNAISGIGMLAVGTLGTPFIGKLQEDRQIEAVMARAGELAKEVPGLIVTGEGGEKKISVLEERSVYQIITYEAIADKKLEKLLETAIPDAARREEVAAKIASIRARSRQGALANMTIFPTIMLVGYLILIAYFRSTGGYKPVELGERSDE